MEHEEVRNPFRPQKKKKKKKKKKKSVDTHDPAAVDRRRNVLSTNV
jgi:hypothetical protein